METLSKLGRQVICKMVGITDNNSIFIKSRKAFIDRMSLLNVMYNVQYLIDIYKEEANQFNSEVDYISFLKESEESVYKDLTKRLLVTYNIEKKLDKNSDEYCNLIKNFRKIDNNYYILDIYYEHPIFEAIRYRTLGIFDIEDNIEEYIYNKTKSKLLAKIKDIDIKKFNNNIQNIIECSSNMLVMSIMSILSPMYINTKELIDINNAGIKYITSDRRSVESIHNIYEVLSTNCVIQAKNIKLDIYKYRKPYKEISILQRDSIISNKIDDIYNIDVTNANELTYYLRSKYSQEVTDYDKYFESFGKEAKYSEHIILTENI